MKRDLIWYVNRIRQMDAAEILWRVSSQARDLSDLVRIKAGFIPRTTGPLPAARFRVCNGIDRYPNCLPESELRSLCEEADELLHNRLRYFGRMVDQGRVIDWHRDWNTNVRPELQLSYFIDYRDAERSGDCKEVWEPNRHHQLVTLGRAYAATGDEKYAAKVLLLLEDWMHANPFGYGMNWRSPLELGVRVINWVWAIDLITDSQAFRSADTRALHQHAYLHCWDTVRKFSQGSSANNHLIGEAAGVFIAASYWFPERQDWIDSARKVLETEIQRQSFASGCTKEQALSYQFFVAQFFTYSGLVGHWSGAPFDQQFWSALAAQYRFLLHFENFGEHLPFFGDKDDGYVLNLGPGTYNLPNMALWNQRLHCAESIAHPSSELLLGTSKCGPFVNATLSSADDAPALQMFEDAGYALLRSNKDPKAICLFDAGPLGYGSIAAHGHADALHFAYSIGGAPFFVDCGTYDYFTYPEQRQYFRSTAAHNTLRLDELDQSEMSGPFMWKSEATVNMRVPEDVQGSGVTGSITQYAGLETVLQQCERTLLMDSTSGALTIIDQLQVNRPVQVEQFFHLHPAVVVSESEGGYLLRSGEQSVLFRAAPDMKVGLERSGSLAQFSPGYHQMQEATCLVTRQTVQSQARLETSITPKLVKVEVAA